MMQPSRGSEKAGIVLIYGGEMSILLIATSIWMLLIWEIAQSSFTLRSWDPKGESVWMEAVLSKKIKELHVVPEEGCRVGMPESRKRSEKQVGRRATNMWWCWDLGSGRSQERMDALCPGSWNKPLDVR